jgi:23S rRNA (guanine2445-N2)-methyltransferase / 23S rRNA (guanine2069-N7)-methyltransferase
LTTLNTYFASSPKGLELLLKEELIELGAQDCRETMAGVAFKSTQLTAYKICLWSRLASRVTLQLKTFKIFDVLDLYLAVTGMHWDKIFDIDKTFAVSCSGTNDSIRDTQFGALKVKDGIVDRFSKSMGDRPNVAKNDPDVRIHLHIRREDATLSLDLCGNGLHQRGYRQGTGAAPLKENLAAAIIKRSGYTDGLLVDPMCGSATLLIEAALMALKVPAGILRSRYCFQQLNDYNQSGWEELVAQAKYQARKNIAGTDLKVYGFDKSWRVLDQAKANVRAAGLEHVIELEVGDAKNLVNDFTSEGTLICNPPYGERMGEQPELIVLHQVLGERLKSEFSGWHVAFFSSSPDLLSRLGMRANKQYKLFNGGLECFLKLYQISSVARQVQAHVETQMTPGFAEDFRNRLKKNIKLLTKWAKKENVNCYRLYDADLPNYNAAIDMYGDWIVVQEYQAPKDVPEQKAKQRIMDIVAVTLDVTGIDPNKLVLKVRQKQKGNNQYEKLQQVKSVFTVNEYGAEFEVNMKDYLDTGLFIDHRLTRQMIGKMSAGKRFLNLFSYTGSASVHAILGGAESSVTVDMSNTYLDWAKRNFELNNISMRKHEVVQADCLAWLARCEDKFDLIFIDPPTFSNSKRMEDSFDVERDHIQLFTWLENILSTRGEIVFSNNKRNFKLDTEALEKLGLKATNITEQNRSKDFARNKNINNCWLVTRVG